MRRNNISPISKPSIKDRLPLKLALVFAAAFLFVFLSGWAYESLVSMAETENSAAVSPAPQVTAEYDSKIEKDLAKVLAFDSIPNPAEIKDPFSDKSGISSANTPGGVSSGKPSSSQQTIAAQSGSTAGPGITGNAAPPSGQPQNNQTASSPGSSVSYAASPEATKARERVRQEKIRLGQDGGPESVILAVDDLLPVGVVSGGSDSTEILLYSQSLMKTFSFPIGTRFYDGWLVDWRDDGVGFAYNTQNGAVFMKQWSRSLPQSDNGKSAAKEQSNQTGQ